MLFWLQIVFCSRKKIDYNLALDLRVNTLDILRAVEN